MSDHERIWLEPICADNAYEGRQWCCDDVWGECGECGHYSVKYVRADLHAALERRIERALELIEFDEWDPIVECWPKIVKVRAILRGTE